MEMKGRKGEQFKKITKTERKMKEKVKKLNEKGE